MAVSIFDLFSVGIGPSSSHTIGPMRAALRFAEKIASDTQLARLRCEFFGSLGQTGKGHGSDRAVLLGLSGERPESVDPDQVAALVDLIRTQGSLKLLGKKSISFNIHTDLVFNHKKSLPKHANGMIFSALDAAGSCLEQATYYSIGGGFVVNDEFATNEPLVADARKLPFPFHSGAELLTMCAEQRGDISTLVLHNECAWRSEHETRAGLLKLWQVMDDCIRRGCQRDGILPGALKVARRAKSIFEKLQAEQLSINDPLYVMDWVDLYALAVNEENAAGGRIVTAPTNGAAGIIPAVLKYFMTFKRQGCDDSIVRFLLTAGAIGLLYKENASISGAEVGCQGEVGVACSMAAGALTEVLGGTPRQVENAAEIGMEHNLGLTCDPVGGLVQIPCIERNAMGAVKAINAARLALRGDGTNKVSLDKVIKTMKETGRDMRSKYKETARGGLAVNIIEC